MLSSIEHAVQIYRTAAHAEAQGSYERAEMLYRESHRIFEYEGGTYRIDAANVMNMVGYMRAKYGDPAGALAAAREALTILGPVRYVEAGGADSQIRLRAWQLMDQAYRQLGRRAEAEEVLQKAQAYATAVFGDPGSARQALNVL